MPRPKPKTEDIINKAKEIHKNKYDYSLTVYKSWKEKITIICPVHGTFEQSINKHINSKQGCPKCNNKNMTTEDFIYKAKNIHGDRYDYKLVQYKDSKTKVKIICPIHGIFEQQPNNHLQGKTCNICGYYYQDKNIFIDKAKKFHNNKYDYSLIDYKKSNIKVKIICPVHGIFEQTPNGHLTSGCPKCKVSKGELKIEEWLNCSKIKFQCQKRFNNCRFKQPLPFDFYLPDYNTCIEFDGEQHFSPMRMSRNKDINTKKFLDTQRNDKIKEDYCIENHIKLIRIPYTKYNDIDKILSELFLN